MLGFKSVKALVVAILSMCRILAGKSYLCIQ